MCYNCFTNGTPQGDIVRMRIAVIADIHGNLEAFTSVMQDIESKRVDTIVSLGDNIGYGANSEEIIQLIRHHKIASIMGNHELAVVDDSVLKWFREDARKAIMKAMERLSPESRQYIQGLHKSMVGEGCLFVHGFPPNSTRHYLFQMSEDKLRKTFDKLKESICFLGHTHMLRLVFADGGHIETRKLEKGITLLDGGKKYIVNAGSVGQPRDGDPHAKYVIWDSAACQLEIRAIPYDAAKAAEKIIAAGIPIQFAQRLCADVL